MKEEDESLTRVFLENLGERAILIFQRDGGWYLHIHAMSPLDLFGTAELIKMKGIAIYEKQNKTPQENK